MTEQQPKSKIRFISAPLFTVMLPIHIYLMFNTPADLLNNKFFWIQLVLFAVLFMLTCGNCKWSPRKVNSLLPVEEGFPITLTVIKRALKFSIAFIYAKKCPHCSKERY